MTYATPLAAVNEALYALFQDSSLQAIAVGGATPDIPEDPTYPLLWFEVIESQQFGGFGTKPGLGTLPEIEIRLHAFDLATKGGLQTCQQMLSNAVALLADPPALSGYSSWAVFHDSTLPLGVQELNGVKVFEVVSLHRLYVQES